MTSYTQRPLRRLHSTLNTGTLISLSKNTENAVFHRPNERIDLFQSVVSFLVKFDNVAPVVAEYTENVCSSFDPVFSGRESHCW